MRFLASWLHLLYPIAASGAAADEGARTGGELECRLSSSTPGTGHAHQVTMKSGPWEMCAWRQVTALIASRHESYSLKVVEDLPFLSDVLVITDCKCLERISNIPQVRLLRAQLCLNLRHVERLDSLQQLFQTEDMDSASSQWLPGLQERHQQLRGEDLDVYTWVMSVYDTALNGYERLTGGQACFYASSERAGE